MASRTNKNFRDGATAAAVLVCAAVLARAAAAPAPPPSPTFAGEVAPILQTNCLGCHNSATKMGGLVMESFDSLMKGGNHGKEIVPGKSDESRLILMLEGKTEPRMPFGGNPLPAAQIATLKAWIDAGAKGPEPGAAALLSAPKVLIPDIKPQGPVVSPVVSLAFSPDGKLLAVGGYQEIELRDAAGGNVVATLKGSPEMVRALAFSPDGKWLATGGGPPQRPGEIQIWNTETHELLRTLTGHKDCVYALAVSPDGKLIASGSYDKLVKLWDAQTGKELHTLKDHIDAVFALAFSPDGKLLASGSQDRTVKVWDAASAERIYTLSDALDSITTLAWHPSGKQLAAGGEDKTIRIWNVTDKGGTLAQSLIAHEDSILHMVYPPDGKTLITTSADRTIRVWDSQTLLPVSVFPPQPDWAMALTVSPDGKWLAVGRYDGTLSLYSLANGREVLGPLTAFGVYHPSKAAEEQTSAKR